MKIETRLQRFCIAGVLLAFQCLVTPTAFAQRNEVSVGMQLLNANRINSATGTWSGLIQIYFFNSSGPVYHPLRFMNAEEVFVIERVPAFPSYRVASAFYYTADNSNFPFDTQLLDVVVEESNDPIDRTIFKVDPRQVDPEMSLQGWTWSPDSLTAESIERYYPLINKTYSRVRFRWTISRSRSVSIQLLLPPLLMMTGVLVSFSLDPGAVFMRISIVQAAFISLTMLHTGQVRELGTGNPMLFDYFMIICYVIAAVSIMINVTISLLWQAGKQRQQLARALNSKSRWISWLIVPGVYSFLFLPWYVAIFILILPTPMALGGRRVFQRVREERAKRMVRDTEFSDSDSSDEDNQRKVDREKDEEEKQLSALGRQVSELEIKKHVLERERSREKMMDDSALYGYGGRAYLDDLSDEAQKSAHRTLANTKMGSGSVKLAKISKMSSNHAAHAESGASAAPEKSPQKITRTTTTTKLGLMSKLFGASSAKLSRDPEAGLQPTPKKPRESLRITPPAHQQHKRGSRTTSPVQEGHTDAAKPSESTASSLSPAATQQSVFVRTAPSFERVIKEENEHTTAATVESPGSAGAPAARPNNAALLRSATSMANLAASSAIPRKNHDPLDAITEQRSPEEPSDDEK